MARGAGSIQVVGDQLLGDLQHPRGHLGAFGVTAQPEQVLRRAGWQAEVGGLGRQVGGTTR
ncbi:hypothetical protein SDC9_209035 [bioreactor metagenome]|uniref:Uncharacterized protein n=1 Tax=bioreactor metagenome TaxID=1076179 RepID=A0A645JDZ0_9ZZZZ